MQKMKMNKFAIFFLLFLVNGTVFSSEDLVFNVTGQPPLNTVKNDGFMDEVVREALKRIGYNMVISKQPAERGLHSADKGLIDGEMSRVKGIDKIYKNLIRVPEKIMSWNFMVFSRKKIDLADGWQSLKNKNVAFINGWKILEKNIPASTYVTKTRNSRQLFMLMKKNRTDYIIYEYWGGRDLLKKMKLKNIKIRRPPLASEDMYIYLHKKHADIIKKLSDELSEMKKDGSYERIFSQHLSVKSNEF